jgi:hypothetical protein
MPCLYLLCGLSINCAGLGISYSLETCPCRGCALKFLVFSVCALFSALLIIFCYTLQANVLIFLLLIASMLVMACLV